MDGRQRIPKTVMILNPPSRKGRSTQTYSVERGDASNDQERIA